MAVGRISGPLLTSTLEREIDLTFKGAEDQANPDQANILHLDFTNNRIGVKKTNPVYPLDIEGTAFATQLGGERLEIDNVYIDGQILGTTSGDLRLEPAQITDKVVIPGNLEVGGNITSPAGVTVSASDNPPGTPVNGSIWMDTDTMGLYIYFQDADSAQWIQPNIGLADVNAFSAVQVDTTVINSIGTDTLFFEAGNGIDITLTESSNTITIASTGLTTEQAIAYSVALS